MASNPIRLGAAALSTLTFETGSSITTSDSGIQTCNVKAICGDGSAIFSLLPVAGTPFSAVFNNNYLPSNFLVDYTDKGPDIEYLEGRVARATIAFRRQDPTQTNTRKIFVDSTLNYKSLLAPLFWTGIAASGEASDGTGAFGFPEPVVTVKYTSITRPGIGSGGLSQIYALPGSANAQDFPEAPNIDVPYTFVVPAGSSVSYYDGETVVSSSVNVDTTFNFVFKFKANPRGWQLTKLKSDPVADASFYDVEENWRNFYFFFGVQFVSAVPPVPP